MPSPFPGMNPYLEHRNIWPEFHGAMIYELQGQLVPMVVPRYFVRVDESVFLRDDQPESDVRRVGKPDLSFVERPTGESFQPGAALLDAPYEVDYEFPTYEEDHHRFLEIVDRTSRNVVTVIELVSPSNKHLNEDGKKYRKQRNLLLQGGVNVVEIDLLRAGPRTLRGMPSSDYFAYVANVSRLPRLGFWTFGVHDPLPKLPVPLKPEENPIRIDLKAALDSVYDRIGYAHFIYNQDPEPPLSPDDAAWAKSLIPQPIA